MEQSSGHSFYRWIKKLQPSFPLSIQGKIPAKWNTIMELLYAAALTGDQKLTTENGIIWAAVS